jgi:hypothetical protein
MGFSDREADAIDPGAADLLMPERRLRPRRPRMRDIEDASFETVVRGRMQQVRARTGSKPRPVFKSRMTDFPADPFARFRAILPHPTLHLACGPKRESGSVCSPAASPQCLQTAHRQGSPLRQWSGLLPWLFSGWRAVMHCCRPHRRSSGQPLSRNQPHLLRLKCRAGLRRPIRWSLLPFLRRPVHPNRVRSFTQSRARRGSSGRVRS